MKALAMIICFGAAIVGFFWSMAVIIENLGFIGGLIAFFVFPLTITLGPFYVGFLTGNWMPLAITYGGAVVASIIVAMSKDE